MLKDKLFHVIFFPQNTPVKLENGGVLLLLPVYFLWLVFDFYAYVLCATPKFK